MGEIWDIYDVNKQLTGRTMKRNDWNMKDGDYHLTVLGIIKRHDNTFLNNTESLNLKHGTRALGSLRRWHARLERHLFQAVCREVLERNRC